MWREQTACVACVAWPLSPCLMSRRGSLLLFGSYHTAGQRTRVSGLLHQALYVAFKSLSSVGQIDSWKTHDGAQEDLHLWEDTFRED